MRSDKAENSRDPITVTVNEACALSGFGPTSIWKFLKDGRLTKVRLPGVDRTLILYESLRQLLEGASTGAQPKRGRGRPRKIDARIRPTASQEVTP
jgi:hypothetical protein